MLNAYSTATDNETEVGVGKQLHGVFCRREETMDGNMAATSHSNFYAIEHKHQSHFDALVHTVPLPEEKMYR